ncbi:MAG: hypothetical protein H6590_06045 [Flavobacteriales bacterium]|nr:hypothetical protein [Flavobacteriales bacterium]
MTTPISLGQSYSFYIGDGSTKTFDLGFPYLDSAHIAAQVDGVNQTNPTDFTITNGSAVFVNAPDLDADVRFLRVTPRAYDARLVDFRAFGAITEDEMDLNQKQIWFLIQEAMETDDSGNVNPGAEYISWDSVRARWSAQRAGDDQRIGNVALPAEGDEAANKDYVDGIAEWGIAGVPQSWVFSTIALTTNYTLTGGPLLDPNYLIVAIDGVLQVPLIDFTVTQGSPNSTLQLLGSPPAAGLTLSVLNFGKTRFVNITDVGPNSVDTDAIQDQAVTTDKLEDAAVTEAKLADGAVTANKLADDAVTGGKLADLSVALSHLKTSGFATAPGGGYDLFLKIREATGTLVSEVLTADDISDWLAALALVRLNQLAAPNGAVNMSSQKLTNLGYPTASGDAASKDYVDTIVGGGVGSKIDMLADMSLPTSTALWQLFSTAPSWWSDSTYLFYQFVFMNWYGVSGKTLWQQRQSGTWRENWYLDGLTAQSLSQPLIWSAILTNPRTGAEKPTVSGFSGKWGYVSGAVDAFGPVDGLALRVESGALPAGTRCLVYGHRALT